MCFEYNIYTVEISLKNNNSHWRQPTIFKHEHNFLFTVEHSVGVKREFQLGMKEARIG